MKNYFEKKSSIYSFWVHLELKCYAEQKIYSSKGQKSIRREIFGISEKNSNKTKQRITTKIYLLHKLKANKTYFNSFQDRIAITTWSLGNLWRDLAKNRCNSLITYAVRDNKAYI